VFSKVSPVELGLGLRSRFCPTLPHKEIRYGPADPLQANSGPAWSSQ